MTKDELVQAISMHDELYWKKGTPIISDQEYDVLVELLRTLDSSHPLVNKINTPEVVGAGKVKHKEPMLSLAKVYTIDEFVLWCTKVSRTTDEEFVIEYKYDGWSASFEDGVLATRGDGMIGEDITSKIPIILFKADDITRGELIIPKSIFHKIKEATGFKNTRNAISGFLNREGVNTEYGKILYFIPFNFMQYVFTLKEIMEILVHPEPFEYIVDNATHSDYPTDGLVIKLVDVEYAKSLGSTFHHSKGEIAFKFPNPTGRSILRDIKWSVGKHVITPVAKIDPVEVSETTITNISLSNMGFIEDNDIHIGDTIIVERSGDVIPHVQSIIPGKNRIKPKIDHCPACGHPVTYEKPALFCNNYNCEGGFVRRLMDSVIRIGIERLGMPTLVKIVETLKVENLVDIFNLTKTQIRTLAGFGDRSTENLYEEIQKVVNGQVEDWRVLSCLNLIGIGTTLSKTLLSQFSLDELRNMAGQELINIEGIGPERAAVLVKGLNENSEYIDNLRTRLTVIGSLKPVDQSTSGENRIKICFTGKFDKPKSYYYGLLGSDYEVTERLESDTSILVVADTTIESNKTKTAKKKGIKIIGINDLFKEG